MRPNDGTTSSVFEAEISPLELFQDLGVMIVEGRLPELSKNGRRTGEHAWPISNKSQKPCCLKESKQEFCKLVSATRLKINSTFCDKRNIIIEVFSTVGTTDRMQRPSSRVYLDKGCLKSKMILLERWEVQIVKTNNYKEHVNVNMVLQAVRSYLHFSQLCAWWNKSHGSFPQFVLYRISDTGNMSGEFLESPTYHKFPLTEISRSEAVQISLTSLPRMDIPEIMFLIKQQKNLFTFDGGGQVDLVSNNETLNNDSTKNEVVPSHYSPNSKQILDAFSTLASSPSEPCFSGHITASIKRKDDNIDLYCASHSKPSNCQQTTYSGEKHLKLSVECSRKPRKFKKEEKLNVPNKACRNVFGTYKSSKEDSRTRNIINAPKSALSLSELLQDSKIDHSRRDQDGLSSMLEGFVIDTKEDSESTDNEDDEEEEDDEDEIEIASFNCNDEASPIIKDGESSNNYNNNNNNGDKGPCLRRLRSKSASPNFVASQKTDTAMGSLKSKPIAARRLAMVAGTVPIFNSKTGLPLSSSPAPIKKPRKASESSCSSSLSKSSSLDDLQPCALGLSRSAPAPTSLLGNFEESVLNGRMPANGTLEGFWAELGASGSFCPKHVSLPVEIQYFSLSDDNAPSPYLGRISLQDKKKKKKKYRLPKKGTVQLTIFNPNNTVVKVFIVLYDFEDMPPCTRTFVRQKIVSVRQDPKSMSDVQTLHYLIHLSFVASKNSHIYLHTDIRVIFRQRVPDEPLITITDGPTHPKYTPIARKYYHSHEENDST